MVFSSIPFLFYFLPLFLIIYYLVPFKAKNTVLLIFSLIFYGWGEPVYILLLVISSVIDYINGLMIEKYNDRRAICRIFLIISIVMNLGFLGIFKYSDLVVSSINNILNMNITLPGLALPVGISFFTFQTMSYSIDVYQNKVKTEHNFINYMTYVSMFPQLVAGPIVRYETVSEELKKRKITFEGFSDGLIRFCTGLFKKVLIANQIGTLWDISFEHFGEISAMAAWLGVLAYAFQIYFDFSGYSDMAIGMGKMLGFTYPENFNYPYISKSITEFWRRWHISLSTWFKLYVYIPLGGNKKGVFRNIINLLIVWSLTGFWHGASYTFLLWGFYYAVLLILEKFVFANIVKKMPAVLGHTCTLFLILLSWVMFAIDDFDEMIMYFKTMFTGNGYGLVDDFFVYNLKNYGFVLVLAAVFSTPVYRMACEKVHNLQKNKYKNIICIFASIAFVALFIVTMSFLVRNTYNPFLYFRF